MQQPEPISAVPVIRDEHGYWRHPDFFSSVNSGGFSQPGEFESWLDCQQLEFDICWREDEVPKELTQRYIDGDINISDWDPISPPGQGWFIGSIQKMEDDGPICIWVRHKGE
jgi:hypothetical protein